MELIRRLYNQILDNRAKTSHTIFMPNSQEKIEKLNEAFFKAHAIDEENDIFRTEDMKMEEMAAKLNELIDAVNKLQAKGADSQ